MNQPSTWTDRGVSHVPLPLSDQGVSTSNAGVWPCGTYTICSFLPRALDFSSGHILQYRTDQFRLHLDVIAISNIARFSWLLVSLYALHFFVFVALLWLHTDDLLGTVIKSQFLVGWIPSGCQMYKFPISSHQIARFPWWNPQFQPVELKFPNLVGYTHTKNYIKLLEPPSFYHPWVIIQLVPLRSPKTGSLAGECGGVGPHSLVPAPRDVTVEDWGCDRENW